MSRRLEIFVLFWYHESAILILEQRVKGYFAAGVTLYPSAVSPFNVSRLVKCRDIDINPGPDLVNNLFGGTHAMYVQTCSHESRSLRSL